MLDVEDARGSTLVFCLLRRRPALSSFVAQAFPLDSYISQDCFY